MKRFYKTVSVRPAGDSFAVVLDERPMKTPGGAPLTVPTRALADAIAAEWSGQSETVDERTMPLTKLANTAIDRADRSLAIRQIETFAGHDLVCYRATEPPALIAREAAAWDPPLGWARAQYGLDLKVTQGVLSVAQTEVSHERLEQVLAHRDEFALTGLVAAAGIMKSLVLALALAGGRLSAAQAHAAAHVDELFQAEKWGLDAKAEARMKALLAELEAVDRFVRLAAP